MKPEGMVDQTMNGSEYTYYKLDNYKKAIIRGCRLVICSVFVYPAQF